MDYNHMHTHSTIKYVIALLDHFDCLIIKPVFPIMDNYIKDFKNLLAHVDLNLQVSYDYVKMMLLALIIDE